VEVNATYDDTILRIKGQSKDDAELAEQVLSWIVYACRPLSLTELQHALAVTPGTVTMDHEAIVDKLILTSVCGGLVVIDKNSSIIRLVRE
jgi:hypothetical protein